MAQINHEIAVTETTGALPNYKWLAHCQGCGFEARAPHPLNLQGSVMTHLTNSGTQQNIDDFNEELKKAAVLDQKEQEEQKAALEKAEADAKKAKEEADAESKKAAPQSIANPTAAEASQPLVEEGHKPPASTGGRFAKK